MCKSRIYHALIFLFTFLITEIWSFYSFFSYGMFAECGYSWRDSLLSTVSVLFILVAVTLSTLLIIYGFLWREKWCTKFTFLYLIWLLVWPIWSMVSGINVLEQLVVFVVYVLLILYLKSSIIRDYFAGVFRYGKYTLYKKEVTLKSGKVVTIYFFSEKEPKSGIPSCFPDGYRIRVNERSKMPYLEKI